jgi:5,10-methylenetetrahydromethanopterin reductase
VSELAYGVGLPLDAPLDEVVAVAREAEQLGYAFAWVNDDRLLRDVYIALAAVAGATSRLRIGPGVTNPYTRHPVLTAVAVATLDELSGGRAVLGLGAGGTNHALLGIRRERPAVAMREAIATVRGLLAGEQVTLEGGVIEVHEARLDFRPRRADVPIYVGARGPRLLELAGELADGVIVGNVTTVAGWRYATERVHAGARRVARDPGEIAWTAWFYACVSDDGDLARDAIRPMVATSLVTSRAVLPDLGVAMPERFADVMDELGWSLSARAVGRAGAEIPAEVLSQFGVAGTPRECRAQLARLVGDFPHLSQIAIVPAPAHGQTTAEVVRRFIEEVAPELGVGAFVARSAPVGPRP